MIEKQIENELKKRMKFLGGSCDKFISHGNNGMPDRICIFPNGTLIFVELKRPKGGVLSKVQQYQHERLRKLHQKVYCIWDLEDMEVMFSAIQGT